MARELTRKERTALDEAERIVDEAIDAATSEEAVEIARRALEVSPLCAEAYVFLAIHGGLSANEALPIWRSGVEAGKLALGRDFEDFRGSFWGFLETRPYMRARHGLVTTLLELKEFDEAERHLEDMLDLNPDDNQGMRYLLMELLVDRGKDKEASLLAVAYKDDETAWFTWPLALIAFRKNGNGERSQAALLAAMESNPHVPDYLTGKRKIPKRLPDSYQHGERDEAMLYAHAALSAWKSTAGALDWLATAAGK